MAREQLSETTTRLKELEAAWAREKTLVEAILDLRAQPLRNPRCAMPGRPPRMLPGSTPHTMPDPRHLPTPNDASV